MTEFPSERPSERSSSHYLSGADILPERRHPSGNRSKDKQLIECSRLIESSFTQTKMPKPKSCHHHNVYVVLLSMDVLCEPRFKRANPDYRPPLPCVYVGMTGLSPDERFDKHKAGIKSNKFVRLYGVRLLPDLYQFYNPMPYEGARDMEVELAIALHEQGYGVWQA